MNPEANPNANEQQDGLPEYEGLSHLRLIRRIGAGSSGVVYLAERTEFAQRVAVKVFDQQLEPATGMREEDVLASLDHPHVVRLIDRSDAGAPGRRFLVMEYVHGLPIDEFCDAARLGLRERAALLADMLDAIAHAHGRLIIHGDLKPANILVTPEGEVRLLDFGSASRTDVAAASAANTPAFASPEQRAADALTLASDLYTAGLVARLVLAGLPPAGDVQEPASAAVLRLPQPVAEAAAAARGLSRAKLAVALRGDLDAILGRALEPEPEQRYGSAERFAGDLEAYLAGRPVSAGSGGRAEAARKWVLRNRALATLSAGFALVLVLSVAGVLWQTANATRERRLAENRLHELVRLTGTLDGELYQSVGGLAQAGPARESLLASATTTLDQLAASGAQDPVLARELAGQYEKLARLELADPARSPQAASRAAAEVRQGEALLRSIPARSSAYPQAQAQLRSMEQIKY